MLLQQGFCKHTKILELKKYTQKTKYLAQREKKTINKELKDIDNTRYKYEIIKQDTSYLERNII